MVIWFFFLSLIIILITSLCIGDIISNFSINTKENEIDGLILLIIAIIVGGIVYTVYIAATHNGKVTHNQLEKPKIEFQIWNRR